MQEWLAVMTGQREQPSSDFIVIAFPSDEVREAYLGQAAERTEDEVRAILRTFVGASRGVEVLDRINLSSAHFRLQQEGRRQSRGWSPLLSEYERRVLLSHANKSGEPAWQGLTWVLDLLPHRPGDALNVVRSYTLAHAQVLPDWRLTGLSDAQDLIRTRYILQGSSTKEVLVELLLSLHWRDFEYFVSWVFRECGYRTRVTPAQKDRGKDVIAERDGEAIYIECKNWRGKVDSDVVAALMGRVGPEGATRGIVVGTSGFTSGPASAREVASVSPARMRLIEGLELVVMANQYLGSEWHQAVSRGIQMEKAR